MTDAKKIRKNIANLRLWRAMRRWATAAVIPANTPVEELERLEIWSGRATLLILFGIVLEIEPLLGPIPWQRYVLLTANSFILLGLAVEYSCIRATIVVSRKVQTESDLKVAEAVRQAAEANAKFKEAELRLVQLRKDMGPRMLNSDAFAAALKEHPRSRAEVWFDKDAADASLLAVQISVALATNGWLSASPAHIPDEIPEGHTLGAAIKVLPKYFVFGLQAWGLAVVSNQPSPGLKAARDAVVTALSVSITPGQVISSGENEFVPPDTIRVLIGPRII